VTMVRGRGRKQGRRREDCRTRSAQTHAGGGRGCRVVNGNVSAQRDGSGKRARKLSLTMKRMRGGGFDNEGVLLGGIIRTRMG